MDYRAFGRTGMQVSSLGLGTMSFGADADEAESRAMLSMARDAGLNFIDTADVYAGGRSEEVLGRLLEGMRDEVVLASKAYFPTGPLPNQRGGHRYHLVRAVEASLRRLRTDRIDVFFLHRFDDNTPLDETLRALEHLVQQGKILYPAASNFAAWQVARALGVADVHGWSRLAAMQPMYNLVKRMAEVELFPLAQAEGLAVVTYSPLGGGLLTGKYGRDRRPPTGRLVDNAMYSVRYGQKGNYEVAERFTAVARARGLHPVTLAIAWVAHHPAVTAPLVGARNTGQLSLALAAADLVVDPDLYESVAALSPAPPPATDRNEESSGHNYSAMLSRARS